MNSPILLKEFQNLKRSTQPSECRRNEALVSQSLLFDLLDDIANFDLFETIRQEWTP